jgi:hypothetical protein
VSQWGTLPLVLLLLAWPIRAQSASAQSSKAKYLRDADHMCKATLEDGTAYEEWHRVLAAEWKGQPTYVKLRAYYKPGSGEFLSWHTGGMSEHGYASEPKEHPGKWGAPCDAPSNPKLWNKHILLLEDGEWADFLASNGMVEVFHSKLKFQTQEKAWSYVAEHWQDGLDGQSANWVTHFALYQQLGRDFFRPKRLEFDARRYSYDSLISATKVDSNWKVEIKGADEPNTATVLLDSNFKLLEVTKNPATH